MAAAEDDPDDVVCLRQHCPVEEGELLLLLLEVAAVLCATDGDDKEGAGVGVAVVLPAAAVVVNVLSPIGATEPIETALAVAVVVSFEELPSTTICLQSADVAAPGAAATVRVASSLPASTGVELPAVAAAVTEDATELGTALPKLVAAPVEIWSL